MKFRFFIQKGNGEVIDLSQPNNGRLEIFFGDNSWNYYNEQGELIAFYPDDSLKPIALMGAKGPGRETEENPSPTPSIGA